MRGRGHCRKSGSFDNFHAFTKLFLLLRPLLLYRPIPQRVNHVVVFQTVKIQPTRPGIILTHLTHIIFGRFGFHDFPEFLSKWVLYIIRYEITKWISGILHKRWYMCTFLHTSSSVRIHIFIATLGKGRCNGETDNGCCTKDTPCEVAEGDCDYHNQCKGDLLCGMDNCAWGGTWDCCYEGMLSISKNWDTLLLAIDWTLIYNCFFGHILSFPRVGARGSVPH